MAFSRRQRDVVITVRTCLTAYCINTYRPTIFSHFSAISFIPLAYHTAINITVVVIKDSLSFAVCCHSVVTRKEFKYIYK